MAPEILRFQGYRENVDIFSIASIFFNLLTGRYLFKGANFDEILLSN
jgi:serine/threonine protein kinase